MKSNLIKKIKKDPYFSKVYSFYGQEKPILEAGFFDNGDTFKNYLRKQDNSWLVTPVSKIRKNLKRFTSKRTINKPLVLITTGAFSPIHEGHINMMELAKKTLEKKGRIVIGGYISPSHDDYLKNKYKRNFLSSSTRIYLSQKEVEKSGWLMVDPWESLSNKGEVTYTEVITRLEDYLSYHFKIPFEIGYVFGSDNAAFARAFIFKGLGICIERPGFERKLEIVSQETGMKNNKNVIFIKTSLGKSISSTYLRDKVSIKRINNDKKYIYVVREDSEYSLSNWKASREKEIGAIQTNFSSQFKNLLNETFKRRRNVYPHIVSLNSQQEFVKEIVKKEKIINLDACTKGGTKINLSRLFSMSDGQISAKKLITRPGYTKFEKRLSKLSDGEYTIVDDDTITRRTLSSLTEFLPERISIKNVVSLLNVALKNSEYSNENGFELFDVIDLRDFIAGSRDGGLVIELPNGKIGRSPYCLPYVSCVTRAKIPPSKEYKFSLHVWELNKRFFDRLKPGILLKDSDKSFQRLMRYVGFSQDTKMSEICRWHIQKLQLNE